MELSFVVYTGSLSALASILGHSVAWSLVGWLRPKTARAYDSQVTVGEALLHMLLGITLGALFWLSWGLAGVVGIQWWTRGLLFGGFAAALTLLPLLNACSARGFAWSMLFLFGSRWLSTCLIVGLACAWTWRQSM